MRNSISRDHIMIIDTLSFLSSRSLFCGKEAEASSKQGQKIPFFSQEQNYYLVGALNSLERVLETLRNREHLKG